MSDLRSLVEALRDSDNHGAADICERAADTIDTLTDRLIDLEALLEGLSVACDAGRRACNLSEGDSVPVLEVRIAG